MMQDEVAPPGALVGFVSQALATESTALSQRAGWRVCAPRGASIAAGHDKWLLDLGSLWLQRRMTKWNVPLIMMILSDECM